MRDFIEVMKLLTALSLISDQSRRSYLLLGYALAATSLDYLLSTYLIQIEVIRSVVEVQLAFAWVITAIYYFRSLRLGKIYGHKHANTDTK